MSNPQLKTAAEKQFYLEFTSRNRHFISETVQRKLHSLRVFIAGCGATGGACVEPLTRLGVANFALADNGVYELNNLNRQHASVTDIGKNKAQQQAEKIRSINPYANVVFHSEGVTEQNVSTLVEWSDFIIDAIDITQEESMRVKLSLHELAKSARKPVVTGMDFGFRQWGLGFDYRKKSVTVLNGRLYQAKRPKNPIKVLLSYIPISSIPPHALDMFIEILENPTTPASQLCCASDAFGTIIAPIVYRYLDSGDLIEHWDLNMTQTAKQLTTRISESLSVFSKRRKLKSLLNSLA